MLNGVPSYSVVAAILRGELTVMHVVVYAHGKGCVFLCDYVAGGRIVLDLGLVTVMLRSREDRRASESEIQRLNLFLTCRVVVLVVLR